MWLNAGLMIFAILFFMGGFVVLPSPFPSVLYYSETYSQSPLALPIQPLRFVHSVFGGANSYTYYFNVSVVLSLPDRGTYIADNPILMNVRLYLPRDILSSFNVTTIDVNADGALAFVEYPPTYLVGEFTSANNVSTIFQANTTNFFSPDYARFYVFDGSNMSIGNSVFEIFQGSEVVEYSTAGQFGLSISFYNQNFTRGGIRFTGFTMHTPSFIPIISTETLDIQRNNALAASIGLFIIGFAALEIRVDTKPKNC